MRARSARPAAGPGKGMAGTTARGSGRWLILAVICVAQLMITLDVTVMTLALPSAQHALGFSNGGRQWIVTAYALSFGSLLLFCGRMADLAGRKVTFLAGLAGFAAASAAAGAAGSFAMLVTARACQGAFAALLAPAALSLLTTAFTDPNERGRAFGVFGAVGASGAALGLLLGGVLTSYASWRWCLYINLVFAAIAVSGGGLLLRGQAKAPGARLDVPGVAAVSGGMFCLVYGFSNAAADSWRGPSTWGFLAGGAALLIVFACWQARAAHPLLPLRVVADRNRTGAYLTMLVTGAGMFGIHRSQARAPGFHCHPRRACREPLDTPHPRRRLKISGRLRSEQAARHRYAIRGSISAASKHRISALTALRNALNGDLRMPPSQIRLEPAHPTPADFGRGQPSVLGEARCGSGWREPPRGHGGECASSWLISS